MVAEKTSTNGVAAHELHGAAVQIPPGSPVQINVEAARAPDSPTPDEIRADTDQLATLLSALSSPVVSKVAEGLLQIMQAKALTQTETAKANAMAAVETEKIRAASNEQTQKVYAQVASQFLWSLLALGIGALGLLAVMAYTKVVDGQVYSVLATVVITSVFGGTIYGTTLRPKNKE